MKTLKILTALVCLLGLTGCIDVSLDFDLKQEQTDILIRTTPQLDQLGKNPNQDCEKHNGQLARHPDGSTSCHQTTGFSLDTWLKEGKVSFADPGGSRTKPMPISVEEVESNTIKLQLDVNTFIAEFNQGILPQDMPAEMRVAMIEEMKKDAADDGFHIAFTGEQVKETNATLSNDGKTVTFFIPMSDIIDPDNKRSPDTYTAVIQVDKAAPEQLSGPVTFNAPEVLSFISPELGTNIPMNWEELIVSAELFDKDGKQAISMVSYYVTDGKPQRFTPSDNIGPMNALLTLRRQMAEDGLGWNKAKLTIKPEGSVKIEPLQ